MKKKLATLALILGLASAWKAIAPVSLPLEKNSYLQQARESFYTDYLSEEQKEMKKRVFEAYKISNFMKDTEENLLARMLLGEAEGCPRIEKIAIAYTAINRANDGKKWNGETIKEAILSPNQYSCFNEDNSRAEILKNPIKYNSQEFFECLRVSREILRGVHKDPTGGATHYYNPKKVKSPKWAKQFHKIGKIGKSYHVFYKE